MLSSRQRLLEHLLEQLLAERACSEVMFLFPGQSNAWNSN